MTDTLPEFAVKIGRLANKVGDIPDSATGAAALAAKRTILAGAPNRLRNVGKRGAKLGVNYRIQHAQSTGSAYAFIRALGPWQIIERDTDEHVIPRPRVRARSRVLAIPGYGSETKGGGKSGFARVVNHPGTKGKHPWRKGVAKVVVLAPKVYQTELALALTTTF